jgi:hypothetical protein
MIILMIRLKIKLIGNTLYRGGSFISYIFLPPRSLVMMISGCYKIYHHRWKAKNQADR